MEHEDTPNVWLEARTSKHMSLQTLAWQSLVQRDQGHRVSVLCISLSALIFSFSSVDLLVHLFTLPFVVNPLGGKWKLFLLVWIQLSSIKKVQKEVLTALLDPENARVIPLLAHPLGFRLKTKLVGGS